ncbi:unconventional myosin-XIX [Anabrus simplex]|uniref:unconventional myosin-XIX n=1 Tax=Anabrus simplex TaxID=316456 RepID=UPI0035A3CEDB
MRDSCRDSQTTKRNETACAWQLAIIHHHRYNRVDDGAMDLCLQAIFHLVIVGILDIYGFEVFENNSLEQLCINYANERLQLFFTRDFLTQQKDLLQDEDHELQLLSHGHSLERVVQLDGPSSVFSVLNEECLLQRYSSDSVVSSRLVSSLGSNKYVSIPRCASSQEKFIVKHYAGDVCYSMNGMLEKNTDKVPREFLDVLRTSTNDFVQKLLDTVEMEQDTAARKNTLLIKFKNSVDSLCKILEKADAHYIRCIKASTHFMPRVVDSEFLHQQLQASGILEIISLSHLYFPIRLKFNEFESRYASCWKDSIKIKRNNDSNHVQLIAERILVPLKVEKQVKFGRESLFLSEMALVKLEKWRSEQRVRAASVIQRAWRKTQKRRESRGVKYSYRLRLVTESGRGDTDQIPHRGTPGRVTGLQGSGDAVRIQKERVAKKPQRCLPHLYTADGIVSRRPLAQVPVRFHIRTTCLPFSHMLPYSELPHGLEDAFR